MAPDENEMARQSGSSGAVASAPITKQEETPSPITQKASGANAGGNDSAKDCCCRRPKENRTCFKHRFRAQGCAAENTAAAGAALDGSAPASHSSHEPVPLHYRASSPASDAGQDHFLAAGIWRTVGAWK